MPDPNDPAAMEERRKALLAMAGGRTSTMLTTPTIAGGAGTRGPAAWSAPPAYGGTKAGG